MTAATLLKQKQLEIKKLEEKKRQLEIELEEFSNDATEDGMVELSTHLKKIEKLQLEINRVQENLDAFDADICRKVTVRIRNKIKDLFLVPEGFADPRRGYITEVSPLGTVLKNKKKGDRFEYDGPRGKLRYEILHVASI